MLPQALQLIPYVAMGSAILMGIAIGIVCFSQGSRRIRIGVSWRQSLSSVFQKLWSLIVGRRRSRPGVIIHDPDSAKPHDLDDPLFDREVQKRIGAAIANAAQKKAE
ncbi:MAG: hypothetical protein WDO17_06130 [Alphaproteobacteria bacterium]